MPRELLPDDDEQEPRSGRDTRVAVVVGGVTLALLAVAVVGGISLMDRFSVEDGPAREEVTTAPVVTPDPLTPPDPVDPIGTGPSHDDLVDQMRPRYRPGPYVQTVGLLPAGMSKMRRFAPANRGGRTVDNPWIVAGAELRPGRPPADQLAGGPGLRLGDRERTNQPIRVIPGSPARLQVVASSGAGSQGDVQGLFVEFEDYEGYFFLPAVVDSELGAIRVAGMQGAELQFGIDAPVHPDGRPVEPDKELHAVVRVASIDLQGRVSPWVRRELRVLPLGTGDVEVTLTMTRATDLDLYVVSPTGATVYYGNTNTADGGHLDLDANAGCGGNMGVNNEHIFWPTGRAPAGTYYVRVANYSSCISGQRVDYTITVRNCSETAVFSGSFTGQGESRTCLVDPGAQQGWCQQVVAFDVTPCAQAATAP